LQGITLPESVPLIDTGESPMPVKSPLIVAFAVTLALGAVAIAQDMPVIDPAIATMTNDQLVEARKNAMMQNGQALRGAGSLTGEQAVAAATTILQNFTNFPGLFKEGSITGSSKATPAIWENWADFEARIKAGSDAAAAMLAAAQSGDTAAYGAAIQAIGGTCGGCHMAYRS
jgi:cytochrome c556